MWASPKSSNPGYSGFPRLATLAKFISPSVEFVKENGQKNRNRYHYENTRNEGKENNFSLVLLRVQQK